MSRLSLVDEVKVTNVISSSQFQIGDSGHVQLTCRVLAVQKDPPVFRGIDGNLAIFDIYTKPIPKPIYSDHLQYTSTHAVPVIKVGSVRVIAAAASSMIHIGSNQSILSESRIKHFRHYGSVPEGFRTRPELTFYT